ncbi:MAG: hypothetical protein DHS20C15_11820 [Planctomycetota bacterium]|nr:MAG: hypothetical protein DHS20C15_11820 [Planctomycetota bacterium]
MASRIHTGQTGSDLFLSYLSNAGQGYTITGLEASVDGSGTVRFDSTYELTAPAAAQVLIGQSQALLDDVIDGELSHDRAPVAWDSSDAPD